MMKAFPSQPLSRISRSMAAPVLSGVLLGLSFPTWPWLHLEPLAWVALVPLLLSLEHEERTGAAFRKAWLSMLVFGAISLWWVGIATLAGGVLTIAVHSLFSTVPLIAFHLLRRRAGYRFALAALPFVWTGWEWAYMQQELSFGWLTLGNSQANLLWMVQYADITGVWGVSFWVVSFNVLLTLLFNSSAERARPAIVGLLLFMVAAPLAYAGFVFDTAGTGRAFPTVRVSLVQPDIDPHEKWGGLGRDETMLRLYRLTGSAFVGDRPDLVIWPETAIPFYIRDGANEGWMETLRLSVDRWRAPLLTGFPDAARDDRTAPAPAATDAVAGGMPALLRPFIAYNASMLLSPHDSRIQVYHKRQLVPFGERVPYLEYFPALERLSFSMSGVASWQNGTESTVMTFAGRDGKPVKTANIICYESIFPGPVSEFVAKGAQFLTLVTNDGWYGTSYGPWQHAAIGRLRCIENRRAMARCANTGVTLCYDRFGRTIAEIPWWEQAVLTVDVPLGSGLSFYTIHPDLFPRACLGIASLLGLAAMVRKKDERETQDLRPGR